MGVSFVYIYKILTPQFLPIDKGLHISEVRVAKGRHSLLLSSVQYALRTRVHRSRNERQFLSFGCKE